MPETPNRATRQGHYERQRKLASYFPLKKSMEKSA
jgi:hypothetical protein